MAYQTIFAAILGLAFFGGCSRLSNRYESLKALCGLNTIVPDLNYIQLQPPAASSLSASMVQEIRARFRTQTGIERPLQASRYGCLALPREAGELFVSLETEDQTWTAWQSYPEREAKALDTLRFSVQGQLELELNCPLSGLLANDELEDFARLVASNGDLQSFALGLKVRNEEGADLASFTLKNFGTASVNLPNVLNLSGLPEGSYTAVLEAQNLAKAGLSSSKQCPLTIKRGCTEATEAFDAERIACLPKLCRDRFKVGQQWQEELPLGRGQAQLRCALSEGTASPNIESVRCAPGYLKVGKKCLGATQVRVGLEHTCALSEDGEVLCWGSNRDGALGMGLTTNGDAVYKVPTLPVPLPERAKAIEVGSRSNCALLASGRVACWGVLPEDLNSSGYRSGPANTQPRLLMDAEKREVVGVRELVPYRRTFSSNDGYCLINASEEFQCWGGTNFDWSWSPTVGPFPSTILSAKNLKSLYAEDDKVCGLGINGKAFCTARFTYRQDGEQLVASPWRLIELDLPEAAAQVHAGLLRTTSGSLFRWKLESLPKPDGPFSNPIYTFAETPQLLETQDKLITDFDSGKDFDCFIQDNEEGYCQQKVTNEVKPIVDEKGRPIQGISSLSTQWRHTCLIQQNGSVYCQGSNSSGQLGDDKGLENFSTSLSPRDPNPRAYFAPIISNREGVSD